MGVSKPQENTLKTLITTQIIVILHYEYKSLQQSQIGTNHDPPLGVGTTPQNHQKGERESKMLQAP